MFNDMIDKECRMFDDMISAMDSIGKYCEFRHKPYKSTPPQRPFYQTEFYNEGWMLKLTIAYLIQVDDEHAKDMPEDIQTIRSAAKRGWMSEGRLSAAFTHEQCTHADAVLGDIKIAKGTKWGVELKDSIGESARYFTVIEAKLGSALSKGTKHAKEFNQAARNLSCMAYALMKAEIKVESPFIPRFFVIMPEDDSKHFEDSKNLFEGNGSKIKEAIKEAIEAIKENDDHQLVNKIKKEGFKDWVNRIECKIITWRTILDKICNSSLCKYYNEALRANGIAVAAVDNTNAFRNSSNT